MSHGTSDIVQSQDGQHEQGGRAPLAENQSFESSGSNPGIYGQLGEQLLLKFLLELGSNDSDVGGE